MKSKSLKIAIAFCAFFLSINISLAFDDLTTHPALTDEVVDFFNLFSQNKISSEEKELIVSGAIGEDTPPRWINHFYDPIRNIGWTGRNTGIWPTSLVRYFSGTVLSSAYPVSSLNWLHNQELQTYYKMYEGNRTWERAVYEYANGNPKEALYTLGYILHLIEDAAVPDHTRDDPHAHDMRLATGDYGSPLEEYAKRYSRNNFNIADELKTNGYKPIVLNNVDDHLVSLAKYSNGYFFSKDTINDPVYQNPKIVKEDGEFGYGKDKDGDEFKIVRIILEKINNFEIQKHYTLLEKENNEIVISQYFTRLSREAIVHGAGVVDLFFKEAEAVILGQKQAPKLFAEEPKSVIQRIIALDAGLGNISATGEFFKIANFTADVYSQAKEKIFAVAADIANLFSSKLNGGLSAALEVLNLTNLENNEDFNSSASNTSSNVVYEIYQENTNPADSSQPATLTGNKIKSAQESLNVLQKQLLVLQKEAEGSSSSNLPGIPYSSPADNSGDHAGLTSASETTQPKFIAAIIPGFGGGGTGVAESSSSSSSPAEEAGLPASSSSSSASSSSESSSSSSSSSSSAGSSSSSSSSSSDTTPPAISSFSILECQNSLSSDGCLVATTTLNIAWNSSADDLDYFIINNNGSVSATTSTSTIAIASDNAVFSFAVSARDSAGNLSAASNPNSGSFHHARGHQRSGLGGEQRNLFRRRVD